jgi:predicted transcriptional regulator
MSDTHDVRADAKRLIDQLPEGASWDDVAYEMYVRAEIERGLADADAGRLVDHQTAIARARARIRRPA